MKLKKILAYAIGGPILFVGAVLFLLPWAIIIGVTETIKWALLNIGGDYKWGEWGSYNHD